MWSDEIQGWKLCGRNFDGEGIVVYTVAETGEEIRIGSDFPNEFKGSEDTLKTKGGYKKAKANLVQGIEKMIYIA